MAKQDLTSERPTGVARPARIVGTVALMAAAGLILAPASLFAQQGGGGPGRWSAGAVLGASIPQGEFADFVDEGFLFGGHVAYALDPGGFLKLRLDGAYNQYGKEEFTVPLSRTVSRVFVDVNTTNNIGMLAVGPELTLAAGPVQPYAHALVGVSHFYTQSSVEGTSDRFFFGRDDAFARSTNFDDTELGYAAGGGFRVPLSRSVAVDVGVQYRLHGQTSYLREGSITEREDGTLDIDPIRSDADFVLVRLGAAFRF